MDGRTERSKSVTDRKRLTMEALIRRALAVCDRAEARAFQPLARRVWLCGCRPFVLRASVSARVDWPVRRVGRSRRDIRALSFQTLSSTWHAHVYIISGL